MPTTCTPPGIAHRELDEQFRTLVWGDRQWLREQFDAIIAAEWPPQPPDPPRPPVTVTDLSGRSGARGGSATTSVHPPRRAPAPRTDANPWQRSPPVP